MNVIHPGYLLQRLALVYELGNDLGSSISGTGKRHAW
jgi:hypothetical protein